MTREKGKSLWKMIIKDMQLKFSLVKLNGKCYDNIICVFIYSLVFQLNVDSHETETDDSTESSLFRVNGKHIFSLNFSFLSFIPFVLV